MHRLENREHSLDFLQRNTELFRQHTGTWESFLSGVERLQPRFSNLSKHPRRDEVELSCKFGRRLLAHLTGRENVGNHLLNLLDPVSPCRCSMWSRFTDQSTPSRVCLAAGGFSLAFFMRKPRAAWMSWKDLNPAGAISKPSIMKKSSTNGLQRGRARQCLESKWHPPHADRPTQS